MICICVQMFCIYEQMQNILLQPAYRCFASMCRCFTSASRCKTSCCSLRADVLHLHADVLHLHVDAIKLPRRLQQACIEMKNICMQMFCTSNASAGRLFAYNILFLEISKTLGWLKYYKNLWSERNFSKILTDLGGILGLWAHGNLVLDFG